MQNPADTQDSETQHIEPLENSLPSGAMPDAGEAVAAASLDSITGDYIALVDTAQTPPPLNRDGTPKRKPGRPRKNPASGNPPVIDLGDTPASVPASPAAPKTPAQRRAQRVSSDELARMILNLTVGGAAALIGEEWQFQTPEEAQSMKATLSAYIESKGDGNASPEAMLLLVTAAYAVPRFAHENTRSKLGAFFGKCWNAITGVFKR